MPPFPTSSSQSRQAPLPLGWRAADEAAARTKVSPIANDGAFDPETGPFWCRARTLRASALRLTPAPTSLSPPGGPRFSFVSPCVLPLAAPYLCYLAGASVEALVDEGETQGEARHSRHRTPVRGGLLDRICRPGATASALGGLLRQWSHALSIAAGIGVIVMGLHFLGVFRIGAMLREKRARDREAGGPVERLSDGLRLRARLDALHRPDPGRPFSPSPAAGTRSPAARPLLAVYSLGLGLPFILAAAAIGPFMRASRHLRAQFGRIEKAVGVLLDCDRRRIPDRRLPEPFYLADRDVSAVRPDRVKAKRNPPARAGFSFSVKNRAARR